MIGFVADVRHRSYLMNILLYLGSVAFVAFESFSDTILVRQGRRIGALRVAEVSIMFCDRLEGASGVGSVGDSCKCKGISL